MVEDTPNPMYVSGGIRTVFEWLFRLLPTGQAIAMTDANITTPALDVAVSVFIAVVITCIGISLFRKKDLK